MSSENSKHSIHEIGEKLAPLLERRPSAKELEEKHVLLSSKMAPALHNAKHDLEKSKILDSLQNKLNNRPDRDELVQNHIIKE
ncbi:hypothetical protein AYI68_g759 [Smittium mucronatum]|uniref:Uncharacterized protein n=1 Tax=Smittium mucronatum TaxID=133383 RepID=A0A1R0H7G8_9FUNG|nr:hypothetical protein AYI68_g759 [Smittium mucronatum]